MAESSQTKPPPPNSWEFTPARQLPLQFTIWEHFETRALPYNIFHDDSIEEIFTPPSAVCAGQPVLGRAGTDAPQNGTPDQPVVSEPLSQDVGEAKTDITVEGVASPEAIECVEPEPPKFEQTSSLRILLYGRGNYFCPPNLNAKEIYALGRLWHLSLSFVSLLSSAPINAGFTRTKVCEIEGRKVLQSTMCFTSNCTLTLTHDIEAQMTRGFWFGTDVAVMNGVLSGVNKNSLYTHHPFFLPRQILQRLVDDIRDEVALAISEFSKIRGDIDNAIGNNYVDGFEYHFYRANKVYFKVRTDVWANFEQAERLGKFLLDGLQMLREQLPMIPSATENNYFEDVVSFDIERLACFKRNIELRDEAVKHKLGLIQNLVTLRDGRVSKLMAETSAQIARESKRDSSASKALAVVATIFLPGTFIASLFATPFFNISPPPNNATLSPKFYLYWVFTLPLTLLTLLCWFAWYKYTSSKHRVEDEKSAAATHQSIFAYRFPEQEWQNAPSWGILGKKKEFPTGYIPEKREWAGGAWMRERLARFRGRRGSGVFYDGSVSSGSVVSRRED